ncbi:DUF6902 family protein [Parasedimentitalea psychrophila]|uniref:Uncharacterized protein n=1 Tax=Parasedimentitalea psychrophila TaxID=2997337 RepID=A0A9Y2KVU8_9RHOB|nr:hypothetical protein [Parasedimentitalea psychrophila]WIY24095.1 hypothetical protein QPJ95_15905 [Parasedimentitalea psychrophila]
MSNVIPLRAPGAQPSFDQQCTALIDNFAQHRRQQGDVFWLKENAELLNILECTGAKFSEDQLRPLISFYHQIEDQICFFQQYYRFILSICLDLEDLGLAGRKGEDIAYWVAQQGLAEAELSDLQRAEAHRLMQRRGIKAVGDYAALEHRLRCFINRSDTFALPNRKAAYELTHIVFYLSEYGRLDPQLESSALISLEYAGLLAYLDQNSDLLAEVCIALHYAGKPPPVEWMGWLLRQTAGFVLTGDGPGQTPDAYHQYFVCNWLMAATQHSYFAQRVPPGAMQIRQSASRTGPLRQMSQMLYELQDHRSADWPLMRRHLQSGLSQEFHDILSAAESSTSNFERFFAGFARAGTAFA